MRMKLRSKAGEMLVESLISLVIISLTGMMLAMAAVSAMCGETQATRTTTFVNMSSDAVQPYPEDGSPFTASLGNISLGTVTVKAAKAYSEEEGLYYYEACIPTPPGD